MKGPPQGCHAFALQHNPRMCSVRCLSCFARSVSTLHLSGLEHINVKDDTTMIHSRCAICSIEYHSRARSAAWTYGRTGAPPCPQVIMSGTGLVGLLPPATATVRGDPNPEHGFGELEGRCSRTLHILATRMNMSNNDRWSDNGVIIRHGFGDNLLGCRISLVA